MTLDRRNIDELFQNRMHGFEMEPSPAVWSRIDEEMGKLDRRRNRKLLRNFVVAASIAASFTLGFFVSDRTGRNDHMQPGNNMTAQVEENDNSVTGTEGIDQTNVILTSEDIENNGNKNIVAERTEPLMAQNNAIIEKEQEIDVTPEQDSEVLISIREEEENVLADVENIEKIKSEEKINDKALSPDMEVQQGVQLTSLTTSDPNILASMDKNISPGNILPLYEEPVRDNDNSEKWGIGGEVAPLYSYRNVETDNLALENNYNEYQSGILAYAGGVNVNYQADKRLSLHTGVYYSKIGNSNHGNTMITKSATDGNSIVLDGVAPSSNTNSPEEGQLYVSSSTGNIEPAKDGMEVTSNEALTYGSFVESDRYSYAGGSSVDILQYFEYVEVPLMAKYKLIDRKIDFNLVGGVSSHVLVGNPIFIMKDGEKERFGETSGVSRFNYSSVIGIGVAYPVTKSLSLSVEPTFKYYLNSFYYDVQNEVSIHPYSFGVFTGISYSF